MKGRTAWFALALILVLAVGLRFYRITGQSLWNDEGTSAALAARDLATITQNAANDIHPPMYYWLLHFWTLVFGNSELALRALSALLGTAVVSLVFAIGKALFGMQVGLLAAFFSAISPFQMYYSQEVRMYILLAAVAALGTYALIRILQAETKGIRRRERGERGGKEKSPNADGVGASADSFVPGALSSEPLLSSAVSAPSAVNIWVAVYGIAVVLGLYTHYSFPLIWGIWILAYLAFWLWRRGRPMQLARWVGLQAIAFAFYLPWLPTGLRQMTQWPAISEAHSLGFFVKDAANLFLTGGFLRLSPSNLILLFASVGVVALAGLSPSKRRGDSFPWWLGIGLVAAWVAVPVLAQWVLSLLQPAYRPKFFLVSAPAFALLMARGALWPVARASGRPAFNRLWAQAWLLLASAIVASVGAEALQNYYYDPAYARDDYRSIARYIEAFGEPGDAVLINAPSQVETFDYYYKGGLPEYPLPSQRPMDQAATESALQEMTAGARRVFAVYWATNESDPDRFIESWMDAHAFKASDDWFGNVRFAVYAVPQQPLTDIAHPLDVRFGDAIQLDGYTLLDEEVQSGGIVQITLFWRALAETPERYKVFVHLLDAGGHVVAQRDAEPGGGARLTTTWQPGDRIADNYGVSIPPGTPPGDYRLEIGMYRLSDGQRLRATQGGAVSDHVLLDPIRVERSNQQPPLSAIPMQQRLSLHLGPLELGGVDVNKLGFEGQSVDLKPGDMLHLTLFWRAAEAVGADYEIAIGDHTGAVSSQGQPVEGRYPASQWAASEVVRDDRYILLPADLEPGRLSLTVSVRTLPDGAWSKLVPLTMIRVVK